MSRKVIDMFWHLLIANALCFIGLAFQAAAAAWMWRRIPQLARWAAERRSLWRVGVFMQIVLVELMGVAMLQIAMWAWVFMLCGEFTSFEMAFYHSAVNFTTLGYGDHVMSESWRILGPLEALNGMVLLGLTSAIIFAVLVAMRDEREKYLASKG
jgi:hypothetical protein